LNPQLAVMDVPDVFIKRIPKSIEFTSAYMLQKILWHSKRQLPTQHSGYFFQ
jgi:hypothetical protein